MICPNCGRQNSAGATFCSRCRQRLPLATKLNGKNRRTVMVEPRGGGGTGAIVLGVALLAGFLFIGGAAAIYLSSPPSDGGDGTDISFASSTPSLPIFVQPTATPNPSPTFILLPSESPTISPSFSPLPTDTTNPPPTGQPTPRPSNRPATPTPAPTTKRVVAKFTWSKDGFTVSFIDQSKGQPTQWLWDFGDGSPKSTVQNPQHSYTNGQYMTYRVKLIVTGPGGTSTWTRELTFQAPPTPTPMPTPAPVDTPTPTPAPTPAPPTPAPPTKPPAITAAPASSESPTP